MNFSHEWEAQYRLNTHMSIWPWSDLVSYVMRYARPEGPDYRVLELGCGAGANIPFFNSLGIDYQAIEGSGSIVAKLLERFPELRDRIVVDDFTRAIPFPGFFDLVVDRASLTHNTTAAIKATIALIKDRFKPGSKFVGIDWFSTEHSNYGLGEQAEDIYTRRDILEGTHAGLGRVHFSDRGHIEELFSDFEFQSLEHKTTRREIPAENNHVAAVWNFVASLRK